MQTPLFATSRRDVESAARSMLLFVLLSLAACSSGADGGASGQSCASSTAAQLGGGWHVSSVVLSLDPEVGNTYVPNGLEDTDLNLQLFATDHSTGQNGEGACGAAYFVSSPILDTTSPTAAPTTVLAVASSASPEVPEGVFVLVDAVYYYPAADVSVELGACESLNKLSDSMFECVSSFDVYAGEQIVALITDEAGVDDDADGQIDEADESEPGDEIDPRAPKVCSGRIKLTFTRGGALASGTVAEPAVIFCGSFQGETGTSVFPARATLLAARSALFFEVDDLPASGAKLRVAAPVGIDGQFHVHTYMGASLIHLTGTVGDAFTPDSRLEVQSSKGTQSYAFTPSVEAR